MDLTHAEADVACVDTVSPAFEEECFAVGFGHAAEPDLYGKPAVRRLVERNVKVIEDTICEALTVNDPTTHG